MIRVMSRTMMREMILTTKPILMLSLIPKLGMKFWLMVVESKTKGAMGVISNQWAVNHLVAKMTVS